jgi:hypothetical protein
MSYDELLLDSLSLTTESFNFEIFRLFVIWFKTSEDAVEWKPTTSAVMFSCDGKSNLFRAPGLITPLTDEFVSFSTLFYYFEKRI